MSMIELIEALYGSEQYNEAKILREIILRKPQNDILSEKDLAGEDEQFHVVAKRGSKVIGTIIIKPISPILAKFRQMAVYNDYQGQGIGKAVILFAEKMAKEKGFLEVEMSARITAQLFYEKLGYHTKGERFIEANVWNIKMIKML